MAWSSVKRDVSHFTSFPSTVITAFVLFHRPHICQLAALRLFSSIPPTVLFGRAFIFLLIAICQQRQRKQKLPFSTQIASCAVFCFYFINRTARAPPCVCVCLCEAELNRTKDNRARLRGKQELHKDSESRLALGAGASSVRSFLSTNAECSFGLKSPFAFACSSGRNTHTLSHGW